MATSHDALQRQNELAEMNMISSSLPAPDNRKADGEDETTDLDHTIRGGRANDAGAANVLARRDPSKRGVGLKSRLCALALTKPDRFGDCAAAFSVI